MGINVWESIWTVIAFWIVSLGFSAVGIWVGMESEMARIRNRSRQAAEQEFEFRKKGEGCHGERDAGTDVSDHTGHGITL